MRELQIIIKPLDKYIYEGYADTTILSREEPRESSILDSEQPH